MPSPLPLLPSAPAGPSAGRRATLIRRVRLLVAATITYNVIEAVIALTAGRLASSTALIGFGLDSIIEVSSAAAVAWQFSGPNHEQRERTALRIIAISFYALAAYVTVESVRAILGGDRAEHSTVGIALAAVSLAVMPVLSAAQRRTGRELGSTSAVADSKQTLLCTYLSAVVLVGLAVNSLFGWWWADPIAALAIAAVAVKEGREAWRGDTCCPPAAALTHPSAPAADGCGDACCAEQPPAGRPRGTGDIMSNHPDHGREHGYEHDGGHAGHGHAVTAETDRRWLTIALTLITVFMAGEVVVGVAARSLALISDAAHMLTDAAAIVLALIAMRLAARPPKGGYTYGLKRAEILSAQANGLTLLLLGGWLAYEAVHRLLDPPQVAGGLVVATAAAGVVVNIAAAWCMSKANRTSLNVEGAFQHILNDLFAFVATLVAGLVMVFTGFTRADAIASLIVVALMVVAGVRLLRDSGRILLEAAPPGVDVGAVGAQLAALPAVVEVHDLHLWQITSGQTALSAHVIVADHADCHTTRTDLQILLRQQHGISHTTLQVDHADEAGGSPSDDAHCDEAHGPIHRNTSRTVR